MDSARRLCVSGKSAEGGGLLYSVKLLPQAKSNQTSIAK